MFLMIKLKLCIFGKSATEVMCSSSVHHIGVQEVYLLNTCYVDLEHLVKVAFARFLCPNAIIFPIIINKY